MRAGRLKARQLSLSRDRKIRGPASCLDGATVDTTEAGVSQSRTMPRPLGARCPVPEEMMTLVAAAERSGQSGRQLGRWCSTGKLGCEPDGSGWLIPASELPRIVRLASEHASAIEDGRVTALAVPLPTAPQDLARRVAACLGLERADVLIKPLSLDRAEYLVAVWPHDITEKPGQHRLRELAAELDGDLLDGEVLTR